MRGKNGDGGGGVRQTKFVHGYFFKWPLQGALTWAESMEVLNCPTIKTLLWVTLVCSKGEVETNTFGPRLTVEATRGGNTASQCLRGFSPDFPLETTLASFETTNHKVARLFNR